ncbi:hypothetical protein [Methylocapsa acidiphila]|uniref:hypothetical protein n=1 Tax=Methylocapsa acidiphila TaxID=133552 RepID=UPI000401E0F7|nr:hypothetical protein [Methylocapsa acidiphila]
MAGKILEAKLVIAGDDRTGAALSAIEKKIARMNQAASAISANARQVIDSSSRVSRAQASIARSAASAHSSGMGIAMGAGSIVGLGATVAGGMAAHEVARGSMDRVHERLRMQASGMSGKEIAEAEQEAAALATKFPAIGQTEIMHMLRSC